MSRRGPKTAPHTHAHRGTSRDALPRCPNHLDAVARKEWRRLARPLHEAGILTVADRAAFAAYCQSYSQWVDAVEKQRGAPKLIKTPSGYVQQSPLIGIANKQLELMGRYMAELGLTPSARSRIAAPGEADDAESVTAITRVIIGGPDDVAESPVAVTRDDTRH